MPRRLALIERPPRAIHMPRCFLVPMKHFLRICSLIVITGCTASADTATTPKQCPQGDFLAAVQEYVADSTFINTAWEPVPGTDLDAVISSGGVACRYGLQEAEVGVTVMWAQGVDLFSSRAHQWKSDGYTEASIDGASQAWALIEETEVERHLWNINLLVDETWIHIGATFLSDLEEAKDLVDAAINVTKGN